MASPALGIILRQPPTGLRALTLANVITDATRRAAVSGDGLAVPGGYGVWPAANAAVLDSTLNGDFETNTTGWSVNGGGVGSFTRITTASKFGAACGQFIGDGGATFQGPKTAIFSGITAGNVYTAQFSIQSVSGSTAKDLFIFWRDAADAAISSTTASVTIAAGWSTVSVTGTAPALAVKAYLLCATAASAAATFNIDGVQFDNGAVALPFDPANTRAAGRVQLPVQGLLTPTQGWMAFRSNANPTPTGFPVYLSWADSGDDNIETYLSGGGITISRRASAVATTVTGAATLSSAFTGAVGWNATTVKASGDGAAFTSVGNTHIPALAATSADLGSRQYSGGSLYINTAARWYIIGKGTLTNADAALPWMTSNTVPTIDQLRQLSAASKPTLLIPAKTADAVLLPAYWSL